MAEKPLGLVSFRRWKDPASWLMTVDILAVLTAAALPWSTSLVAIFAIALLISMGPFLDVRAFLRSLKHPAAALPIALVALALLGTLWSDASWPARLYAVSPTAKLLVLPVLLYHYQRSTRAMWVFTAFLLSCTLLMVMSWIVAFDPTLALKSGAEYGVPVKNYIDQSQEFALCAVALAYPVVTLLRVGKIWLAVLLGAVALGFVVNMTFVVVSRTALVTMPIMLAVFALLHLKWRTSFAIFLGAILLAALAWTTSPTLQRTTESFFRDYSYYQMQDEPTSIGIRLEFWKKSLRFFAEAPIIGHGTGSTRGLFEHVATSPQGERSLASSQIVGNPHNQTLNVAIQWGVAGIFVLYAMWLMHLRLFRGDSLVSWIGLLVLVQNVFTSLFNSHLFDFHEGWMYVVGVGIAGGTVLRTAGHDATSDARNSASP